MQEIICRIELAAECQGKHQRPVEREVFRSFSNQGAFLTYLDQRNTTSQYDAFESRMAKDSLQVDCV